MMMMTMKMTMTMMMTMMTMMMMMMMMMMINLVPRSHSVLHLAVGDLGTRLDDYVKDNECDTG